MSGPAYSLCKDMILNWIENAKENKICLQLMQLNEDQPSWIVGKGGMLCLFVIGSETE